jgi:hypothetical protein
MEVLQRIKFLMEYDVMKTSSENILFEQSTDLQKLAKEKGFGPVSLSKAQELYNQGKLGNTFGPISGQAKVLASRDPAVIRANQQKYGTIDVPRTDVSRMYSQMSPEVIDTKLDELTIEVRNFMSNWKTATAETIATVLGVGIPVVIAANGLWLTLEVRQALKGNPDYLSLVFAFIATATAGSQSAVLKPLYQAVGKSLKGGGKDFVYILELLYFHAKELGLWNKLKPILQGIKTGSKFVIDGVTKGLKWINENVLWIFKGAKWLGQEIITFTSGLFKTFDTWLANVATRSGVNPQVAQKLGSATRWGSVPFVLHTGAKTLLQPKETLPTVTSGQLDKLPYDSSKWKF